MTDDPSRRNTSRPAEPTQVSLGERLAGKFMTFKLDDEDYGLPILKVREIIALVDITRVPRTAPFIRGVINLRGKVYPVIDLKMKFGMGRTEFTDQTVIIVVSHRLGELDVTMGVLVDEVVEVLDIGAASIEPPPFGGDGHELQFILGVGKTADQVIFLLDVDRVLDPEESRAVARSASTAHGSPQVEGEEQSESAEPQSDERRD